VLGCDPQRDGYALRPRIGVQLQESMLQDRLRVSEALLADGDRVVRRFTVPHEV